MLSRESIGNVSLKGSHFSLKMRKVYIENSYLRCTLLPILIEASGINFFHLELENSMDFSTEMPSSKEDFIQEALSYRCWDTQPASLYPRRGKEKMQ